MAERLKTSLGTEERKAEVLAAAREMEERLPHGGRWGDKLIQHLRRLFEQWVEQQRYLWRAPALDAHLPDTVLRPDLDVAVEYGLKTQKGIEQKQQQISTARDMRIARCADHLRAGWPQDECIGFVAAKDEWRQAMLLVGRRAA